MPAPIQAILFDLDGVITDSAEYHYQSWQEMADAQGLTFGRTLNEQLRGVSRRESLDIILRESGREVDEATALAWMDSKNTRYREMLQTVTREDLLPGVEDLLNELRQSDLKIAVASGSRNTPLVLDKLGITDWFDGVVAGPDPGAAPGHRRPKPAPDLFLRGAAKLGVPPAQCIVVEDAASGVDGARAAGMVTVGIGPVERVGHADLVLPNLESATVADLLYAATFRVIEPELDPAPAAQQHKESVFTIGNGSLGTRGSLEEGTADDRPATLLHGLWDDVPTFHTELANSFDWTALDLWVDGTPFHLDRAVVADEIADYSRWLDLRTGELHRRFRWTPSEGHAVEVHFTRMASLADPHALALRLEITPLDEAATVRVRQRLNGHVENDGLLHWRSLEQGERDGAVYLVGQTRGSQKALAEAMQLSSLLNGAPLLGATSVDLAPAYADCAGNPGLVLETTLAAEQPWVVDKFVSVYLDRDAPDPLAAALAKVGKAASEGFAALALANAEAWSQFWRASDVIIRGDDVAQVALRHAIFQLRIAAPGDDIGASIGARGLSGLGYRGHIFWDTDIFVLPFFTFTQPALARNLLMYRWHTLEGARKKAAAGGFEGAQFAWESAETGDEVTPRYLPDPNSDDLVRIWTGDLQIHLSSDVAYAIWQYWRATGDADFFAGYGAPIILETARFWESRVEPDVPSPGAYSLSNVLGPDENHDNVDNNAFTNEMVAWHLKTAAEAWRWLEQNAQERAKEIGARLEIEDWRLGKWRDIAEKLVVRQDDDGLVEQFEGFFDLHEVDWAQYANRTRSMQAILGVTETNDYQVLKQADVLMLMILLGNQFDARDLRTNWDYYEPRTDHSHGSSLGPAIHAWVACKLGMPDEAYKRFMHAALTDIDDVRGNARDGIHVASAGGLWQAVVFGFAGLTLTEEDDEAGYTVAPQLPSHWERLAFSVEIHGERHEVNLGRA